MKPSWSSVPASSTARSAPRVPGRSRAIGFSQNAGMPARAARAISSACAAVAEAITTASTPHVKISLLLGAAVAPQRSATSAARTASVSATTREPTSRWRLSTPA
ncbi:hypothetical protein RKD30_005926 [Streptomyces pristinaespiralis]